jgi:hypothetical protein
MSLLVLLGLACGGETCVEGTRVDSNGVCVPEIGGHLRPVVDTGPSPDSGTDSGTDSGGVDVDGDGYLAGENPLTQDCDDTRADVFPDADEYCDLVDNDCDTLVDERTSVDAPTWYFDRDRDGFGDPNRPTVACEAPYGYVAPQVGADGVGVLDCDDTEASIYPGAAEACNGLDDDCDAVTDDAAVDAPPWYADADGDGWGDPADALFDCYSLVGRVADASDCNDAESDVHPGGAEVCENGLDDDCDGTSNGCAIDDGMSADDAAARLNGADSQDYLGYALVGGQDWDDDGLDDLVMGAPFSDRGAVRAGAVYVAVGWPGAGTTDVGVAAYTITGDTAASNTGSALAGGDVDGDGVADLLVGGPGLPAGGAWLLRGPFLEDGTVADGESWTGESSGDAAGSGVAILGDIDDDGVVEFALAAPGMDAGGSSSGGVLVLAAGESQFVSVTGESARDRAGTALLGRVDLDADGTDDLVIGAPGEGSGGLDAGAVYLVFGGSGFGALDLSDADVKWLGEGYADQAGTALACAGDSDGDGKDDLLVGGPGYTDGVVAGGMAWLVTGVDGGSLADVGVARIPGTSATGGLGASLAGAGDLDGDGELDFVFGAPRDDRVWADGGAAFVLYGPATGTIDVALDASAIESASSGAGLGWSVNGLGDFDGDSFDDIALGSASDSDGGSQAGAVLLLSGGSL